METWGAGVVPSPSTDTEAGRKILEADPETSGSLGMAISEAVNDAATDEATKYSLGSVLSHVLLHQTVIGQEAQRHSHRLRGRRLEFRRARHPVRQRQAGRQASQGHCR